MVNRALELDANDAMSWIVLSRLTTRDARNPLQRAYDLAPGLPLVQYEYGTGLLYVPNGFQRAREAFDRTLELSPRHFQALIGKVYSFTEDEYSDQTEPLLRQAVDIAPGFLTGRRLLGEYYAAMEETEKAVEQFQAATASNPNYYPAFLALGRTLMTAGRNDEAEKSFLQLIALDVTTPRPPLNAVDYSADCEAHYFLGNIWFARGDMVKARAEYLRALDNIRNHADSLYGLGMVLLREGDVDGALARFDQVLREHPAEYPEAYMARASIRVNRRQFADAVTDYTRAMGIFEKQLPELEKRASTAESRGRLRKAFAERTRKSGIEGRLEQATQSRRAAEAQLAN